MSAFIFGDDASRCVQLIAYCAGINEETAEIVRRQRHLSRECLSAALALKMRSRLGFTYRVFEGQGGGSVMSPFPCRVAQALIHAIHGVDELSNERSRGHHV